MCGSKQMPCCDVPHGLAPLLITRLWQQEITVSEEEFARTHPRRSADCLQGMSEAGERSSAGSCLVQALMMGPYRG